LNQLKLVTSLLLKQFKITLIKPEDCIPNPKIVLRMKDGMMVYLQQRTS